MNVCAYVLITTRKPRKTVQAIRKIGGATKADALFGTPNAVATID